MRARAVWATMLIPVATVSLVATRTYEGVMINFAPAPSSQRSMTVAAAVPGLRDVTFLTGDGTRISGWYVAGDGATVVVLHGANADRSTMALEVKLLAQRGFGVLAYDSPGLGASEGEIHWGSGERLALTAAVDWLSRQPGVDAHRIGALGFSFGGYILAQVAARDPRLKAVALVASPSTGLDQVQWEFRKYGWLSQLPARWILRARGMSGDEDQPVALVQDIAPRPLLIIGGTADQTVPLWMAHDLYRAARQPKQLWIATGAAHGGYLPALPQYGERIVSFFSEALTGG